MDVCILLADFNPQDPQPLSQPVMPYIDYDLFLEPAQARTPAAAFEVFESQVIPQWVEHYKRISKRHGDITRQNYHGYIFGFDHVMEDGNNDAVCQLPDSRVVFAFGISAGPADAGNRKLMKSFWGSAGECFQHLKGDYDKGHFIAHASGGPIDINLFPQRRDINRGWSEDGKRFRAMERHIASHPGTFVFSRPLYVDFSSCPAFVEFGYFDTEGNLDFHLFPNT